MPAAAGALAGGAAAAGVMEATSKKRTTKAMNVEEWNNKREVAYDYGENKVGGIKSSQRIEYVDLGSRAEQQVGNLKQNNIQNIEVIEARGERVGRSGNTVETMEIIESYNNLGVDSRTSAKAKARSSSNKRIQTVEFVDSGTMTSNNTSDAYAAKSRTHLLAAGNNKSVSRSEASVQTIEIMMAEEIKPVREKASEYIVRENITNQSKANEYIREGSRGKVTEYVVSGDNRAGSRGRVTEYVIGGDSRSASRGKVTEYIVSGDRNGSRATEYISHGDNRGRVMEYVVSGDRSASRGKNEYVVRDRNGATEYILSGDNRNRGNKVTEYVVSGDRGASRGKTTEYIVSGENRSRGYIASEDRGGSRGKTVEYIVRDNRGRVGEHTGVTRYVTGSSNDAETVEYLSGGKIEGSRNYIQSLENIGSGTIGSQRELGKYEGGHETMKKTEMRTVEYTPNVMYESKRQIITEYTGNGDKPNDTTYRGASEARRNKYNGGSEDRKY